MGDELIFLSKLILIAPGGRATQCEVFKEGKVERVLSRGSEMTLTVQERDSGSGTKLHNFIRRRTLLAGEEKKVPKPIEKKSFVTKK